MKPVYSMCVRLGINLEVFQVVLSRSGITAAEIAQISSSQEEFIGKSFGVLSYCC